MLPSAKSSLIGGGFSPKAAAWTLIACFLAGAVGIQLVSRILHHYIPSHVVDCEHTHDEEDGNKHDADLENGHSTHPRSRRQTTGSHKPRWAKRGQHNANQPNYFTDASRDDSEPNGQLGSVETFKTAPSRRPSLQSVMSSTFSKLANPKHSCDGDGPCYGFSEPCGQECFKVMKSRGTTKSFSGRASNRPPASRSATMPGAAMESTPLLQNISEETSNKSSASMSRQLSENAMETVEPQHLPEMDDDTERSTSPTINGHDHSALHKTSSTTEVSTQDNPQHHHHVPTNAFLSIGLQTSIAIALHKLPEGFITYATNHANPKLGFSVFLALFIHNITEGFAMALPLYLAINSRWKAMFWSSLLGGFSQPLGAGVAAMWFKLAGSGDMAPGEGVYGAMFAVTAGIMASVALQLFSESLDLTHNRGLCMIFAFVGMGILGISSALTA